MCESHVGISCVNLMWESHVGISCGNLMPRLVRIWNRPDESCVPSLHHTKKSMHKDMSTYTQKKRMAKDMSTYTQKKRMAKTSIRRCCDTSATSKPRSTSLTHLDTKPNCSRTEVRGIAKLLGWVRRSMRSETRTAGEGWGEGWGKTEDAAG